MKDFLRRIKNLGDKKDWQAKALLILGVLGMLLLCLTGTPQKSNNAQVSSSAKNASTDYSAQLESRLQNLVESVDGVGKARVMVTFETSEDTVYAVDNKTSTSGSEETHVLLQNGSSGLVETVWMPEVQGVAVVCEGAGSPLVESQVTQMLSVLLGVSTNRISIAKLS